MARLSSIGTLAVNVVARTSQFDRGINRVRRTSRLAAEGLASIRLGAIAAVGGLIALGKANEDLQRSMNRSLAIMGDISKTMRQDMTNAAIEVAKTTNASAKQAAEGFFFLASAGLDAEQSLAALPKVAKFAQAGNFDLALATDLLTDAQSALGLTTKDTEKNLRSMVRVSDVLVKANTLANATVQQFSESLTNKAGAALRLVNKDIEEGVAVLAVYADQGLKGAESGTALGIVMRDLQTKALKHTSRFREAGIAVFDAAGNFRNFADVISDLENRLIGLSDAQKKQSLLNLGFADKSVQFIQALIGTSDKIRAYEEALRGAGGATDAVADKQLTNLEKATNKLGAAFTRLSQSLSPVVDLIAGAADKTAALIELTSDTSRSVDPTVGRNNRSTGLIRGLQIAQNSGLSPVDLALRTSFLNKNDLNPSNLGGRRTGGSPLGSARQRQFATPETIAKAQIDQTLAALQKGIPTIAKGFKNVFRAALERREAQEQIGSGIIKGIANGIRNARNNVLASVGSAQLGLFEIKRQLATAQLKLPGNEKASVQDVTPGGFRRGNPFLDASSSEGFSALRKNLPGSQTKPLEELGNQQLRQLVGINNGIEELVGNQEPGFSIPG